MSRVVRWVWPKCGGCVSPIAAVVSARIPVSPSHTPSRTSWDTISGCRMTASLTGVWTPRGCSCLSCPPVSWWTAEQSSGLTAARRPSPVSSTATGVTALTTSRRLCTTTFRYCRREPCTTPSTNVVCSTVQTMPPFVPTSRTYVRASGAAQTIAAPPTSRRRQKAQSAEPTSGVIKGPVLR
ncbi:hypothetical protein DPMN_106807 [Dreissena polymorpha]|uniref:Uncharacterized protein n=1 Tax=Dreissena polymorpha TaxID=45954 RepID=A0A9D4K5N6_DREPO|nr:hypothetical protein DPMN_106807 [Dreissena polymorpha]